jgi:hypothetical protein
MIRPAHLNQLGRRENKQRKDEIRARLARHAAKTEQLFREMGLTRHELGAAKFKAKL